MGFQAFLLPGGPSGNGIFLFSKGSTTKGVRSEDPVPGGGTFRSLFSPSLGLNDKGQVAFWGAVSPPGRSGIFRFSEAVTTQIIGDGNPAPDGGTLTLTGDSSPSLNALGQVAFRASLSTGGSGIFLFS